MYGEDGRQKDTYMRLGVIENQEIQFVLLIILLGSVLALALCVHKSFAPVTDHRPLFHIICVLASLKAVPYLHPVDKLASCKNIPTPAAYLQLITISLLHDRD